MKKILIAAAAATVLVSGAAYASDFIDGDGFGWVGKGNVQTAFGWNNNLLQRNAGGVSFTYNATNSWECVKVVELGNGGQNVITKEHNTETIGVLSYVARSNSNGKDGPVTGFHLNGFSSITTTGGPARKTCPDPHSRFEEQSFESSGGLYVNHGGTSVLL